MSRIEGKVDAFEGGCVVVGQFNLMVCLMFLRLIKINIDLGLQASCTLHPLPQSPTKALSSLYTPGSLIIFVPQGGRYHYGQFLMKEPNKIQFLKTPKN
jgi:hypothetical protein